MAPSQDVRRSGDLAWIAYAIPTKPTQLRLARRSLPAATEMKSVALAPEESRSLLRWRYAPVVTLVLLMFGIVLAVLVEVGFAVPSASRRDCTELQLMTIVDALALYKLKHKTLPTTDDGLGVLADAANGKPLLYRTYLVDAWDQPFRYRRVTPETYLLMSAGPDRVFDTCDDVRIGRNRSASIPCAPPQTHLCMPADSLFVVGALGIMKWWCRRRRAAKVVRPCETGRLGLLPPR